MRNHSIDGRKRSLGRWLRLTCFCVPAVAALALSAVQAQQLPSGSQLQQLQQQFQQQQQNGLQSPLPAVPAEIVQQPARAETQAPLPPSRLEQIMSARAGATLRQFGYDRLGSGRSVTLPQSGAMQDDYVLGPGDEVVVSLRGQENSEFRTLVDRNGQVILPRLSPISATGRSFGSFRQDIQDAVRRAYVATSASVSVGRVRQVSVLVSGEVNVPGQRQVSGLSSAADALLLSGGVKKTGSLRNIRIQRNGREYVVDLYNILTDRGAGTSMRLTDGDRIIVPPLGRTVAVSGLVRRPGIYELPSGQSALPVRTLMSLAGGVEVRGRYRYSLLQITPDGRSSLADIANETGSVRDSEILFVQLGADQTANQAQLSGGTGLAGSYAISPGTKLSALLRAPGALGASPYTLFGVVVRRDRQTLLRNLIAFTPVAVMAGREDIPLQDDDKVKVFTVGESRLMDFVARTYLQRLAGNENASPSEYVFNVPAQQQRQTIISLLDVAAPGSALASLRAEQRRRDLRAQRAASARNPAPQFNGQQQSQPGQPGQPGQQQQQQQQDANNGGAGPAQAGALPDPNVDLDPDAAALQTGPSNSDSNGPNSLDASLAALSPNAYDPALQLPGNSPAQNFMEQSAGIDAFPANREAQTFGQLTRQLNIDPLVFINFVLDHRARLEGSVQGPGEYLVGPSATLAELVQAAGGVANQADESSIEIISTVTDRQSGRATSRRQNLSLQSLASYVVQPRDQFRFAQSFADAGAGTVSIQGQVRYPGTFSILRGEHLSDLMARAGGLTRVAYPYGAVFTRQSAARTEREGYQRAASEVQNQLVVAMTRVGNDKIDPNTFASMQTFVNELRNQKALGRIAITADPSVLAAKPETDPLLENGDTIFIPQRPDTVSVLGQVMQPGNYPYRAGVSVEEYISKAGGYSQTANSSDTFVVLPDGTARKLERSFLSFSSDSLPPGSTIVIPRDVTPLDLRQTIIDVSQIFSQFAVAIASVAVLSKQ